MVIKDAYENKFLRNELTIGLGFQGKEVSGINYKRISLLGENFKDVERQHYKNIRSFGFYESFDDWGMINEVYCFYNNKIVGMSDEQGKKYRVTQYTTVIFDKGNFEIWFTE